MAEKKTTAGSAETANAQVRLFRHSRTGAVRRSRTFLGFPYVEMTKAELSELDKAAQTTEDAAGGAKGGDDG